jgi:hypothetical protein
MRGRLEFWELAACGAAAGGASVWGLAALARLGWLRAFLELFPRSSWDGITWILIPALLLFPSVVQGAMVAALASHRSVPARQGVAGSVSGTLLALGAAGAVVMIGVRRLPASMVGMLVRTLPEPLILGCGVLIVGGWLLAAGRLLGSVWLRRAAFPLAVLGAAAAWGSARGWALAATYVLDRAEVIVFFGAVVIGGAVGSAGVVRGGHSG